MHILCQVEIAVSYQQSADSLQQTADSNTEYRLDGSSSVDG